MSYYCTIILLVILAMIMELIHLSENESLKRRERKYLQLVSSLIIFGAASEFLGVFLDGKSLDTRTFHIIVKTVEFSVSPIIPYFFCRVVFGRMTQRVKRIVILAMIFNILLEIVNIFVPFIFYIDDANIYRRGNFYFIYVIIYVIGISAFIVVFYRTIKKCQNKNLKSLISLILFLISGVCIRLFDSSIRTDWLVVAILNIAFISYYSDLVLKVDVLTKLLNRRAYENYLKRVDFTTCIIRLDINNFKNVNDTYGHQCGDMCIKAVASTILKVYGKYAYCYRTGGDEFDVIFKPDELQKLVATDAQYDLYNAIEHLNDGFDVELKKIAETLPMLEYGCAKGYGIFYGFLDSSSEEMRDKRYSAGTISEVISIADSSMYENKKNFKKN